MGEIKTIQAQNTGVHKKKNWKSKLKTCLLKDIINKVKKQTLRKKENICKPVIQKGTDNQNI